MKIKIFYLQSIIITIIIISGIIIKSKALHHGYSIDTSTYFAYHKYKCFGEPLTWQRYYEFFFDIFSLLTCENEYENFVTKVYYSSFFAFFFFNLVLLKKFGFNETVIFIIIFFLAINPNHMVSQSRQMMGMFLFFSGILLIKNNKKTSFLSFLMSFLTHNNSFIFLMAIYLILKAKSFFNFIFKIYLKNKIIFNTSIFIIIISLINSRFLNEIYIRGIYLFDTHGSLGFFDKSISSFSKYIFFAQIFTAFYMIGFKVKSDLINFIAAYSNIVFFLIFFTPLLKINFDITLFRLIYVVKYIFIPFCFIFIYMKIIGKKINIKK